MPVTAVLSSEEMEALYAYALKHGRNWKARLRADWHNGGSEGTLQALRNSLRFGPSGLKQIKIDLAPAPERS